MGRAGIAVPLVLLVLTGCSAATASTAGRPAASGTPVQAAPSVSASDSPGATGDPRNPPRLFDAQRTFVTAGGRTGPHVFPVIPDIRRGTLEVGVICSGSGTVEVKVGSLVSYSAVCADGDPGQNDESVLYRDYRNVSVTVTSRTPGPRGLSVGWTRSVAEPRG
ncbi:MULTISPECIES: hypothetical protein [unclassified Streptomyces]|uniref:hypothetical protein n=1 Tax=unclassified Streptomyces TaxID=2593676 RepID=UPI003815C3A1